MTERIRIPAHEAHVLRVFAIDESADSPAPDEVLREALGAPHLDTAQIELFPVTDLQDMRLSGYLARGHGIPADQLDGMRGRLDGLTGRVLLLPSRALGGAAQEITPRAPLRLVGRFSEETPAVRFDSLPDGGAAASARPGAAQGDDAPPRFRNRAALWLVLGLIVVTGVALVLGPGQETP